MEKEGKKVNSSTYGVLFANIIVFVIIISLAYVSVKEIIRRQNQVEPFVEITNLEDSVVDGRVIYEKKEEITDEEVDEILKELRDTK